MNRRKSIFFSRFEVVSGEHAGSQNSTLIIRTKKKTNDALNWKGRQILSQKQYPYCKEKAPNINNIWCSRTRFFCLDYFSFFGGNANATASCSK